MTICQHRFARSSVVGVGWVLPAVLTALSGGAAARVQAARPFDLPLSVREDQGVDRVAEPLASGIPLPPGAVSDPGDISVYDVGGAPVPCQAHQIGLSWPDGSLRWVLLQFEATVPANSVAVYRLKVEPEGAAALPVQPVAVKETEESVEVDVGPLSFSVSRRDFRLPNRLTARAGDGAGPGRAPVIEQAGIELVADREYMSLEDFKASGRDPKELATYGIADTGPTKWGKLERGIDYGRFMRGPVSITVEEHGPLRAVLRRQWDLWVWILAANAALIPFTPFSTFREPWAMLRFGTGLVLAWLLFAADQQATRSLRRTTYWIFALVFLLGG